MPIGAENIGTAYVRVIADGKDFDLAEMFEGVEGDADHGGRRLSQAYQKGFIEEWKKAPNQTKLQKALRDSLITGDAAKMFTATKQWQRFRDGLVKEYGEIGRRAGENLEREMIEGLDVKQVETRLKNLRRDLARAEKELNAEAARERENEWRKHLDHMTALEVEATRERKNTIMLDHAYRMNKLFDMRREIEMQRELVMLTRAHRDNDIFDAKVKAAALDHLNTKWRQYHTNVVKVADAVGVAFGRGSRNNFLNFMGSVARNVVSVGANLVDFAGRARQLADVFREAGGGIAGVGAVMSKLAPAARLAAAGLAGLFVIIGPLLSILSGLGGVVLALTASMGGALLGAVSALTSTIALGLGGGLAIASSALVPLVVGIGVFTLAVKNADKETKVALKSITKEFSGLGQVAAESTFSNITEQARRFRGVIGDLSPVVRDIGQALSRVGDNWLDMMEGPGFTKFQSAMTKFLPGAVESLGNSIGSLGGALGGMFRAVIPQSQNLLGWIEKITREFNEWANSMSGQKELSAFFDRAADSARELGDFVQALGGFLGEIIDQANGPGDRLFANMTQGLKSWTDILDRNPDIMGGWMRSMQAFGEFTGSVRDLLVELLSAGQQVGDSLFASMSSTIDGWVRTIRANPDILRGWYDSAAAFGRALGQIVLGLGKVFAALDNTFSRAAITAVFTSLAAAIDLAAGSLRIIASIFGEGEETALGFAGQVAGAAVAVGLLSKALGAGALASLGTFITNLRGAETRMTALAGAARVAGGAGGLLAFSAGASASNDAAGVLLQTLGGAGAGFALGGPWGALLGGAAGLAMGIFSRKTDDAAASAASAKDPVLDFASSFDAVTAAATTATRAIAENELRTSGAIDAAAQFGISQRDLVNAVLGHKSAQERVNAVLDTYQQGMFDSVMSGRELTDEEKALAKAFGLVRGEVQETTNELAKQQRQAGLTAGAVQPLGKILEGVRDSVRGPLKLDIRHNIPVVVSDFSALINKYKLVPKEVRTLIKAFGGELTKEQINDLIRQAKELDRQRPNPKVTLDKSAADSKMREVRSDLDFIGRISKTPKVGVDAGNSLSVIGSVKSAIDNLRDKTVNLTTVYKVVRNSADALPPRTATGGTFSTPQTRLIAEAGSEAVVPLNRNLSQVDPSVRMLSAIAQGKMSITAAPQGPSKTISADGWTIVTPSKDPEAVAREVFDRLAGVGY